MGIPISVFFSLIPYALAAALAFLPGWVLTRKLGPRLRTPLRAGLATIAFAPGLFISPGGEFAAIAPVALIVLYYWSERQFLLRQVCPSILITGEIVLMIIIYRAGFDD